MNCVPRGQDLALVDWRRCAALAPPVAARDEAHDLLDSLPAPEISLDILLSCLERTP